MKGGNNYYILGGLCNHLSLVYLHTVVTYLARNIPILAIAMFCNNNTVLKRIWTFAHCVRSFAANEPADKSWWTRLTVSLPESEMRLRCGGGLGNRDFWKHENIIFQIALCAASDTVESALSCNEIVFCDFSLWLRMCARDSSLKNDLSRSLDPWKKLVSCQLFWDNFANWAQIWSHVKFYPFLEGSLSMKKILKIGFNAQIEEQLEIVLVQLWHILGGVFFNENNTKNRFQYAKLNSLKLFGSTWTHFFGRGLCQWKQY
jgi:hypothetical protein